MASYLNPGERKHRLLQGIDTCHDSPLPEVPRHQSPVGRHVLLRRARLQPLHVVLQLAHPGCVQQGFTALGFHGLGNKVMWPCSTRTRPGWHTGLGLDGLWPNNLTHGARGSTPVNMRSTLSSACYRQPAALARGDGNL